MASNPHNAASNKGKPWPAYFIVRTSGEVVPLIGLDELPIGIDLVGVPRALDLKDTIGMLNLGIQRSSEAFYRIAPPLEMEDEDELVDTKVVSKPSKLGLNSAKQPQAVEAQQSGSATRTAATGSSSSHSQLTNRPTPSRNLPETQTCRHWCTHGICKWGQQCRYRHIMPMTLSGLQEIDLNDWPPWYRALNPGYFASETTHLKLHSNARRGGKGRVCSGKRSCCGGSDFNLAASHARAEGLRTATSERERVRRGEVGEATLTKLRGSVRKDVKNGVREEKAVSGTVMLERAAVKDARDWEEEGSEVSESKEEIAEKVKVVKSSLLD